MPALAVFCGFPGAASSLDPGNWQPVDTSASPFVLARRPHRHGERLVQDLQSAGLHGDNLIGRPSIRPPGGEVERLPVHVRKNLHSLVAEKSLDAPHDVVNGAIVAGVAKLSQGRLDLPEDRVRQRLSARLANVEAALVPEHHFPSSA